MPVYLVAPEDSENPEVWLEVIFLPTQFSDTLHFWKKWDGTSTPSILKYALQ